jgi:hypothetical protein
MPRRLALMAETESQKEMDNIKKLEDYVSSIVNNLGVIPLTTLEGNFTAWALLWHATFQDSDLPSYLGPDFISVNEAADILMLYDDNSGYLQTYRLSTGVLLSSAAKEYSYYPMHVCSELGTYFAVTRTETGKIYLEVYKNCVKVQDTDMSSIWSGKNSYCMTVISKNGKYILVSNSNNGVKEVALFKGS